MVLKEVPCGSIPYPSPSGVEEVTVIEEYGIGRGTICDEHCLVAVGHLGGRGEIGVGQWSLANQDTLGTEGGVLIRCPN